MLYLDLVPDEILSIILCYLKNEQVDVFLDLMSRRNVVNIILVSIYLLYPDCLFRLRLCDIDYIKEVVYTFNIPKLEMITFTSSLSLITPDVTMFNSIFNKSSIIMGKNTDQIILNYYKFLYNNLTYVEKYIRKEPPPVRLFNTDYFQSLIEEITYKSFNSNFFAEGSYYRPYIMGSSQNDIKELVFMLTFPKFYLRTVKKRDLFPHLEWNTLYYSLLIILLVLNKVDELNDESLENVIRNTPPEYWYHYPELLLALS